MTMGAPRKEIDYVELEKLVEMQATEVEIASFFDVTDKTLNARIKEQYNMTFSEYKTLKGGKGKISLRQMMWQSAKKGNTNMQIFLSKNMLGMADKQEIKTDEKKSVEITFVEDADD